MKKYVSKTSVSISVMLASGVHKFVEFTPQTRGGSVYYTDDKELQQAMERHYRYGRLFRADPMFEDGQTAEVGGQKAVDDGQTSQTISTGPTLQSAAEVEPEQATEQIAEEAEAVEEAGLMKVEVTDPDAAKQYLAEHYGLAKSTIKSVKAIKAAAAEHGIEFVGI